MIALFWIAVSLLMATVIFLLCLPLMQTRHGIRVSRKSINIAIFRDQMAELASERDSGILSSRDYAQSVSEAERRILDELVDEPNFVVQASQEVPKTAVALLLLVPVLAVTLYLKLGHPENLGIPPTSARSAPVQGQSSQDGIIKTTEALEAKLDQNPNSAEDWALLVRGYQSLGRWDEAENALVRAGDIIETYPPLMMQKIEMTAYRNDGHLKGKSLALLKALIKQEPENPVALLYAGNEAYFHQQYGDAARYWEKLLRQVPPGSEDAVNLGKGIDRAKSLMGRKNATPPGVLPWVEEGR